MLKQALLQESERDTERSWSKLQTASFVADLEGHYLEANTAAEMLRLLTRGDASNVYSGHPPGSGISKLTEDSTPLGRSVVHQ